jgi:predicted transposase/invertase (TIGR01784 family)
MLKLLEEPIMSKALNALEEISSDPINKELAEMREKARVNLHIITSEAKAEGMAEGEAKGKAEGIAEGIAEGEAKGEAKGKAESILKMASKGFDIKEIARIFDMTVEEIQSILKTKI